MYLGAGAATTLTGFSGVPGENERFRWSFETSNRVTDSPTVVNGMVFVGSHDSKVYAMDAETGEEEWTFETEAEVYSSPTIVDGTLFVGSDDYTVCALDAGVDGSSEGSRVTLETLGQQHRWDGTMPSH